MTHSPHAAYRQSSIQTATPERLLIMLYDGLITELDRAGNAIREENVAEAHAHLVKAQDILREGLWGPLDTQYEVGQSLATLYEYLHRRLVQANVQKDNTLVEEVLGHVRGLREVWVETAAKAQQERVLSLNSVSEGVASVEV